MNTNTIMIFLTIAFFGGIFLGSVITGIVTAKFTSKKPSGTIKVLTDHEDGSTYLFLELEESINILAEKDTAVVKISRKN